MNLSALSAVRRMCQTGEARAIRINAGVSLRELANEVGVQPHTVQRWEVGHRMPRGEFALRYHEQLGQLAAANEPA